MKGIIVGFGSIGKRHCKNITNNSKNEVLLCTNQKGLKLTKSPKVTHLSSLEKCLEYKPEIAFICDVTSEHVNTAIKLAKNNCHLFIEKPLSNSLHNIKKLVSIIEKKKLITFMGFNLRFHPCVKKIRQMVLDNKIGDVLYVEVENGSYLPDWHKQEDYRTSYAGKKDLGGGVVLTLLHEIDYLYWILGDVISVNATTAKLSNLDIDTEDFASILLKFQNKTIAHVQLNYFQKIPTRTCKFVGTKGILFCDINKNIIEFNNYKKKRSMTITNLKKYNINSSYVDEISHFMKCIKNKKKSLNDIYQGIITLKIALAILKSSKTNKMVQIEKHS